MIFLKDIVEIFDLPSFNYDARSGEFQDRVNCLKANQIGAAFVMSEVMATKNSKNFISYWYQMVA